MKSENNKLIIDGNAFYELDLDCVRRRCEHSARKQKNSTRTTSSPESSLDSHQEKRQRK